jgi:hypothetical protein
MLRIFFFLRKGALKNEEYPGTKMRNFEQYFWALLMAVIQI